MPIIQSDASYYSIDGNPANDLRYGSISLPSDSFATPSLLGLHDPSFLGTGITADGRTVSYGMIFASQPWVYIAVMRLLTWAVRVPLKAYLRTGVDSRERLRPGDHPVADALAYPWNRGAPAQLVQALLGPLLVHGNSTLTVDSGAGDSIAFKPRDWRYMRALTFEDEPSVIRGWETDEEGRTEVLSRDQTIHTAWWNPMGPLGMSPLAALGVSLAVEDAALRYSKANLLNMARPPSAITVSEQWLDLERTKRDEVIQQLRAQVTSLYSGPENGGKVAILPTGLDWKAIGHTAQEAQLIEVRKVARNEVASAYMVPPPMIGILDDATYSNISVQREMAYTDGLAPPLTLIEQNINAQLIHGLLGLDDVFVEFDFAGVLRGDRLKEVQAIREAIGTGILTPNEGRRTLNYPSSEQSGADHLYLPTNNLTPIGQTQDAVPDDDGVAVE
jgi:HK97 family phage portal protein